ncbi:autotransporter assembly complex family protein [Aliiglaciecola litoralis]|uniref:Autotransporter assembly complex family protein n=1 Tax=Aliiglaciecola litoralis TaxID=582857 RepID=A0ABN1LE93_9ALTE
MFYRVVLFVFWCVLPTTASALDAKLRGIENSALEENIQAHLSQLNTPSNCRLSEDALATIEGKVTKAAQALGFYQLTIDDIKMTENDCEQIVVSIQQHAQVTITQLDVKISGDGETDEKFIQLVKNLPLRLNAPLIHNEYKKAKGQLDSLALNRGYFDSRFITSEIKVDVKANTASITLHYQTGPRYQFGNLIYPEDLLAKELISNIIPFSLGQPYLASLLGEFNRNLGQTGYFQQVVARPILEQSVDNQIPIEIVAVTQPRDIFNVGGGASTDKGPTGSLTWQRPWVNRHGHSIKADLFVSKLEQSASMRYKIPLEDPLHNYFSIQSGYNAIDNNDSNSDTVSVAVQRHWTDAAQDWNKIAFLRYSRSRFEQADEPQQTTYLLVPGFTLSRHRSRGGLDVDWGDSQLLTIEVASDAIVSDIDLARVTFETKWLRSIGDHRFLIRGEIGALKTDDFSRVPDSLRYFTGGDQSIRGFDYKELAPRGPATVNDQGNTVKGKLLGGKYLNVASLEYSYPVSDNWRAMLFTDVGGASDKPFETIAYSFGIGASWMSPVGPIRLYLAKGFGDYGQDGVKLHIAMGPAL